MATKRKVATGPTNMNFRPSGYDTQRSDAKGTRPTANPATVRGVLLQALMFLCKKIIFFDVNLKVALYLGSLFLVSLIGDFKPYPKTYFSRSDNIFNVYFVKWGWAWTLALSIPYVVLTSCILCCGKREKLFKEHLPRIAIATFFWFVWTKAFNYVESMYGRCNAKGIDTKIACLKGGHFWHGFDISGHAFILIYSSLVLIEEAKPIIGWENIKEHLRNEEHNRNVRDESTSNPLRNLENDELQIVKQMYEKYTPFIRALFISMTALQLLWDVMLICTMLYYHKMIEKVLSGIFAILTWFFTYRAWYPANKLLPNSAGQGKFLYQRPRTQPAVPFRKQSLNYGNAGPSNRSNDTPKFMGLPIYQQKPTMTTE